MTLSENFFQIAIRLFSRKFLAKNLFKIYSKPYWHFQKVLLNTTSYALLNTFRKKRSNQAIFNESAKTKKSEKIGKLSQVGTLEASIVLYSTNVQK